MRFFAVDSDFQAVNSKFGLCTLETKQTDNFNTEMMTDVYQMNILTFVCVANDNEIKK